MRMLFLAAVFLTTTIGSTAVAVSRSPFSEFQRLPRKQLASLAGRLGVVGDHLREEPVLIFCAAGHPGDPNLFEPFFHPHLSYHRGHLVPLAASLDELRALIDSVATLPSVTHGGADVEAGFSFALVATGGDSVRGFETVIDRATAGSVVAKMFRVFAKNSTAIDRLTEFACHAGLLPGPVMAEVTSGVSIRARGFRRDHTTGQYVGSVRITNTTPEPIEAPILFVYQLVSDVTALAADGVTCAIWPPGEYQTVRAKGRLKPGESVDALLYFDNPDEVPLQLNRPRVFAGSGFR